MLAFVGAVQQSQAGDGMDFVSATVPKQQPQIIKNMANKKVAFVPGEAPISNKVGNVGNVHPHIASAGMQNFLNHARLSCGADARSHSASSVGDAAQRAVNYAMIDLGFLLVNHCAA